MKKRRKIVMKGQGKKRMSRVVALLAAVSLLANTAITGESSKVQARRVTISETGDFDRYTDVFADSSVDYDAEKETVNFTASSNYSPEDELLFEPVNLEENSSSVRYSQNAASENRKVRYTCSFDMNKLMFHFEAKLLSEDGTVLKTEKINTKAIVTKNGGLDACVRIDGRNYWLSDYENSASIDACSLKDVLKIVNAFLKTAETAEKMKAKSNYKYNKKLESGGNGVGKDCYIYNQSDTTTRNRRSGNYRFGFTTFRNVGCEVAAAYNVALALKDTERLSQTIYYFETLSIMFSIGWGHLGSNPGEISRYLKERGFSYKKYTSFKNLSSEVAKRKNCKIIMSRWNAAPTTGLHTFYVKKENKKFYGYNWRYEEKSVKKTSLKDFNNGSGFIVGYIVWK